MQQDQELSLLLIYLFVFLDVLDLLQGRHYFDYFLILQYFYAMFLLLKYFFVCLDHNFLDIVKDWPTEYL